MTMINHFLDASGDIVERHNGVIIDYLRNGFLCVFGAPIPEPNHADEAVIAAIELQEMVHQNNLWNYSHNYPYFEIGIGVHTEQILLASIGTKEHRRYTPLSNEIRRCTSISAFAPTGQVLASRSTIDHLSRATDYTQFAEELPDDAEFKTPVFRISRVKSR